MPRYYDHYPPPLGDFTTPKGKRPNVQFNQLIEVEGEVFRNPIGLGYSAVPITQPILCDTHLGVIEVVGLSEGFKGMPEMPRGFKPPLPSMAKHPRSGCTSQPLN